MEKVFGDKKITIRKISKKDLNIVKEFKDFINSLIKEDAKILMNREADMKGERAFIKDVLAGAKNKTKVYLVAECDGKIIGTTSIKAETYRRNHVGNLGIAIKNGYRGLGLGKFLMSEIIALAKREIKPTPKIISLTVYENNTPAINLYEKIGFKKVARVPKQIQYGDKLIDEFMMLLEL